MTEYDNGIIIYLTCNADEYSILNFLGRKLFTIQDMITMHHQYNQPKGDM